MKLVIAEPRYKISKKADIAKDLDTSLKIVEKGSIMKSKTREMGGTFRTGMHPWRSGETKSIQIK